MGAPLELPRRLHIELSSRCNALCTTCVRTFAPDPDRDLTLAQVRAIVDGLPNLTSVALQVNGEPLLYAHLAEVLAHLHERDVRVELNTNGLGITARTEVLLSGHLDYLNVSLDGAHAETFERHRGIDAFDRVVAGTRALLEQRGPAPSKPRVALWMTATRHNLAELPDLVALAADIGADEVFLQRLVYFGHGLAARDASLHGRLTDAERNTIADADTRARARGVALRTCGGHGVPAMLEPAAEPEPWRACRRPSRDAVVMANGDLVPCCISTFVAPRARITMGNVLQDDWSAIWNGPKYTQLRQDQQQSPGPDFCHQCGVCWSL